MVSSLRPNTKHGACPDRVSDSSWFNTCEDVFDNIRRGQCGGVVPALFAGFTSSLNLRSNG